METTGAIKKCNGWFNRIKSPERKDIYRKYDLRWDHTDGNFVFLFPKKKR